jgi:hypothetical protein
MTTETGQHPTSREAFPNPLNRLRASIGGVILYYIPNMLMDVWDFEPHNFEGRTTRSDERNERYLERWKDWVADRNLCAPEYLSLFQGSQESDSLAAKIGLEG